MIMYWAKLLKSSDTFLPKRIYTMLKEDADSGNTYNGSNWASHIKSMLNDLGFSYIWLHQTDINIPLNAIKQRIYDSYSQSWYAEINNSNRLITYARYKHKIVLHDLGHLHTSSTLNVEDMKMYHVMNEFVNVVICHK